MTDLEKVIKGLQIERECVSRDCDRDCGNCDLVQDRDWLLSVYDDAIDLLKEQEPIQVEISEDYGSIKFGECPKCESLINNRYFPKSCGCGQAVKWNDIR